MYSWHTSVFPTPSYDGQLHVDQYNDVYEWYSNSTGSRWKKTEYELRKTQEYNVYLREFVSPQQGRMTGRLNIEWNTFYSHAFAKISWDSQNPTTGDNPLYVANITHAELSDLIRSRTPLRPLSSNYDTNVTVTVYEVFELGMDRKVLSYNELYSQARGYLGYNRRHGRPIGHPNSGCIDRFRSVPGTFWTDSWTYPAAQILNDYVGGPMVPETTDSNDLFWFHSNRRGLYRQPYNAVSGVTKKILWDGDLSTFRYATPGESFTVGPPILFGTELGSWTRQAMSMASLRGTRYFFQRMKVCVIYPLHYGAAAPGGKWALYMKPYGVDTLGIGLRMDGDWKTVVEYVYDGGEHETVKKLITLFDPWDDWNQLHRVYFHPSIGLPHISSGSLNIDCTDIPDHIRFYALNTATGRRSEIFSRGLKVERRKRNISICLVPAVFRTPMGDS